MGKKLNNGLESIFILMFALLFGMAGVQVGLASSERQLIKSLKNKDPQIRRESAEKLGAQGGQKSVKPLIKLLNDKDLQVRISAAISLGDLGDEKSIKPLMKAIQNDEKIRPKAIMALAKFKDPQTIPLLIEMLGDENSIVVFSAAVALGQFEGDSVVAALNNTLSTTDDFGCQAIVNSMARQKNAASLKPIQDIIINPHGKEICLPSAIYAAGQMGDPTSIPILINQFDQFPAKAQKAALRSLGQLKAQEAFELASKLSQTEGNLQVAALECVIGIKDPRGISLLQQALKSPDPAIQKLAKYGLNQYGIK